MADGEVDPNSHAARADALFKQLWNDGGEAGRMFRAKAKELYPDVKTPEDSFEPVLAPMRAKLEETQTALQAALERLTDREKKDAEADEDARLARAVEAATAKFRLTDDGRAKMLDRMKETHNYTDAEAAAAWVASTLPPPAPATPSWRTKSVDFIQTHEGDDSLKRLHADPSRFMDDELEAFIRDPDGFTKQFAPEYFNQ